MLLIGLDTETTHEKPEQAELLQLGMVIHDTSADVRHIAYNSRCRPKSGEIPQGASDIHGIYIDELKYQPLDLFVAYAADLVIRDCSNDEDSVLVTYNGESYDLPVLAKYGVQFGLPHIDVYRIVQRGWFQHGLKLGEVYEGATGNKLEDAHDAIPDVNATLDVLLEYLKQTGKTAEQVAAELAKPIELEVCYFGKHAGTPFRSIPRGYLRWVRDNFTGKSVDLEHTLESILGA